MIPGVLTFHICNSSADNFGKPIFQRNQNRQLYTQTSNIKPVIFFFRNRSIYLSLGKKKKKDLAEFGSSRTLELFETIMHMPAHNMRPEVLTKITEHVEHGHIEH